MTIPPEDRDPHLMAKLRKEWPGILAWAVMGCLDWQRQGIGTPSEVMVATESYQADQDAMAEYLNDRCIRGAATFRVPRNELYADYQTYCHKQNMRDALDRTAFFDRIRRVPGIGEGQPRIGGVPTRVFTGIGLCATAQQAETGFTG